MQGSRRSQPLPAPPGAHVATVGRYRGSRGAHSPLRDRRFPPCPGGPAGPAPSPSIGRPPAAPPTRQWDHSPLPKYGVSLARPPPPSPLYWLNQMSRIFQAPPTPAFHERAGLHDVTTAPPSAIGGSAGADGQGRGQGDRRGQVISCDYFRPRPFRMSGVRSSRPAGGALYQAMTTLSGLQGALYGRRPRGGPHSPLCPKRGALRPLPPSSGSGSGLAPTQGKDLGLPGPLGGCRPLLPSSKKRPIAYHL